MESGTEDVLVADLFDPDDLVSQWVFAITATVEDLSIAESLFKNALDNDAAALLTGYHYRQLIARLYEAERVVLAIDQHQDVRDFVSEQADAQPAIEFLRDAYLPLH